MFRPYRFFAWATIATQALVLAAPCAVSADEGSKPATASSQSPVSILACAPPKAAWMFKGGRAMPIIMTFKNSSDKAITSVRIDVSEAGIPKGGTTFSGTFSPGAEIKKGFLDREAARLSDPSAVTCSVSNVHFEDGSTWQGNSASSVISDQPDAPIKIHDCSVSPFNSGGPDYNQLVTLSFRNTSARIISAAKFNFVLLDAFNNQLTTVSGTVYGHFSPGALIEPMMSGVDYVYTPSSPAWRYYFGPGSKDSIFRNIGPTDIATSKCSVSDVRFDDGTIWKASGA